MNILNVMKTKAEKLQSESSNLDILYFPSSQKSDSFLMECNLIISQICY